MTTADIVFCLHNTRKQCAESHSSPVQNTASQRDLLSHCTVGQSLSERQTNMVLDVSSGFRDLTGQAFDPDSQLVLYDLLGDLDGSQLVSFLKEGPLPIRDSADVALEGNKLDRM